MEKRLENRLQTVYNKIKREKEKSIINNDIKNLLEEFKQPKEEPIKKVYSEESQKAQIELLTTKKRLAELEVDLIKKKKCDIIIKKLKKQESKSGLISQVQGLRDQLSKLETATVYNSLKTNKSEERNENYQKLEKEIEYLKSELTKSRQIDKSDEIVKQIEKHERQKDFLSDHNQVNRI